MTKDFSKYQTIIDNFRGNVTSDDFENRFNSATKSVPKTERFLLKMELKRLATPCTRLIDLRGNVDGECRAFEHEGRSHFLDDIAIKVFEESVKDYGSYTFGVYEAAMNTENNFRIIYQREKDKLVNPTSTPPVTSKVFEKTQYPAKCFSFGPYFNRIEERMNFAIALSIYLDDDTAIEATSSDISENGCKFRFSKKQNIKVRQLIDIRFTGLEGEFQFGKDGKFSYEVRSVNLVDGLQLVGVQRVYTSDKSRDGFAQFLKGFIQGNKRRYKINLENTINALHSRSLEQFVLPKCNELPIFIEDTNSGISPRYVLTCHNNQSIYQYWQDETRHSTLNCLVTADRVQRLRKYTSSETPLLVYSFIHESQGKYYFYTADSIQLNDDEEFKHQFWGFAANKPSFAIHQLYLLPVNKEFAHSPLTLANNLAKRDQHLNLPVSEDVHQSIANLSKIVIANQIKSDEIIKFYQGLPYDNINTSKLKNFGHKRGKEPLALDDVGINYNNHRQEPRFKYKTPVVVKLEGVKWSGKSEDFSTSGLKIEIDKPSMLVKGNIIDVSFPQLQKITSSFDLTAVPYEVMRVSADKTVINLRVYVEKHQHIGRSFFKALIDKNRDKLTPDEYAMLSPGLAKALRNIYSQSLQSLSLVVQTSGSRYKIETITTNDTDNKLLEHCKRLSDRGSYFNLYPLLSNLQATNLMNTSLKKMLHDDEPIVDTLYVAINPDNEIVDQAVKVKLEAELQSDMLKKMFIKNALKRGKFYCLQIMLSRTDDPDMQHLNPELSYIGSYAIHRGKQIEQEIWSVAGLVQVTDITNEALNRYQVLVSQES